MSEAPRPLRTLIAGVGHFNLSDLSLGPIVAAQLREEHRPQNIEVDDLSYGPIAVVHRLGESTPPYERLVLVAAVDRGFPEPRLRCYRWDGVLPPAREIQARVAEAVTGIVDLDNLLVVTGQFGVLPREVYVVEVQPLRTEYGLETSAPVTARLPEVRRLARALAESPSEVEGCPVAGLGGAREKPPPRTLIAGVGNVLRGDDGFGVEVLRRLESELGRRPGLEFYEAGIAGVGLAQKLLEGYDVLVILDAMDRKLPAGTVSVIEPDLGKLQDADNSCEPIDLHQAGPGAVLKLARSLGVLPQRVVIVGCQAVDCDELGAGLSEPVRRAVPEAVARVREILTQSN
jgi:hydrogenase maturation protease